MAFRLMTNGSNSEVMRLEGGSLLVGTTDSSQFNNSGSSADTGVVVADSFIDISRVDNSMLFLNRCNTNGDLITFSKDGSSAGSMGTRFGNTLYVSSSQAGGLRFTLVVAILLFALRHDGWEYR